MRRRESAADQYLDPRSVENGWMEPLSFLALRAGWAILGRRCRRERLVLILGAIVELNSANLNRMTLGG
jgi:hypothetical protein